MMSEGRFEAAIPIYRELIRAVPGEPGLVLNLALAQHMAGHDAEAIPNFEAVLKVKPDLPGAVISLAEAFLDTGRYDRAAEQFRKLTSLAPGDSRAWYGLGMSYQAIARGAFDRLQKAAPQSPYAAVLIADARAQQRQYESALSLYRDTQPQLPNLHGIHTALAGIYRNTGHADRAAEEDAKEQALPAADCAAHPAECQFLAGKDLQAATLPRTATPSPEALFWQAKAANELAYQAFFQLGQLPPSVELHQLRAEIARNQGQHLESAKEWRAALDLDPQNPRAKQELAFSLFLAKDYRAALDAIKDLPRSPELNFAAGDSLLRLEQPEEAVPYLRAALAANPKLTAAKASLGLALARLGKNAEAIPLLEASVAMDEDGALYYQLARAYQATGQQEKARAALAKYQEMLKKRDASR